MRLVCDVVRVLLRFGSVRLVLCCCGVDWRVWCGWCVCFVLCWCVVCARCFVVMVWCVVRVVCCVVLRLRFVGVCWLDVCSCDVFGDFVCCDVV